MAASMTVCGWTEGDQLCLLEIWGREEIQALLDGTIRDKKVYEKISKQMAQLGYEKNKQQVQDMIKRFRRDYKVVQDNRKKTGRGRKTCEFYEKIDGILGHKPSINPPEGSIYESSVPYNEELEGNSLDSDDEADISLNIVPPTPPPGPSTSMSSQAFSFRQTKRSTSTSDDESGGRLEDDIFVDPTTPTQSTPKTFPHSKVRRINKKQKLDDMMDTFKELVKYQKDSDKMFLEFQKERQIREDRMRAEDRAHELEVLKLLIPQPLQNISQPQPLENITRPQPL